MAETPYHYRFAHNNELFPFTVQTMLKALSLLVTSSYILPHQGAQILETLLKSPEVVPIAKAKAPVLPIPPLTSLGIKGSDERLNCASWYAYELRASTALLRNQLGFPIVDPTPTKCLDDPRQPRKVTFRFHCLKNEYGEVERHFPHAEADLSSPLAFIMFRPETAEDQNLLKIITSNAYDKEEFNIFLRMQTGTAFANLKDINGLLPYILHRVSNPRCVQMFSSLDISPKLGDLSIYMTEKDYEFCEANGENIFVFIILKGCYAVSDCCTVAYTYNYHRVKENGDCNCYPDLKLLSNQRKWGL